MQVSTWARSAALRGVVLTALVALPAGAQPVPGGRIVDLSLEELSRLEITSVSKRAERLSDAPTSVFVITAADIRRTGATSLPEALRLAPNLQVARVSASEYAISARGFNGSSANKLLVLVDGRSVYSPLYSGVFWDVQDVMLEDLDRIEVISGPGGTLWGVNAVNGIINVITREAGATRGGLAALRAGSGESRAGLRWGGAAAGADWRAYATLTDRRDTETAAGTRVDDSGHLAKLGLRADARRGADRVVLQAEVYDGRRAQPAPGVIVISGLDFALGPIDTSGAHVLARWERRLAGGALLEAQAYADRTRRRVVPTFASAQDIADVQVQHTLAPAGVHRAAWGVQARYGRNRMHNSAYVAFLPARLNQKWLSVYAQDEIALRDDLRLTVGARAERNDYTGTEFLPTARLAWQLAPQHLLWTAASRTVRAPSRLDHDTFVPGEPPYLLRGGPGVQAETADVLELGYRGQPVPAVSLSATLFHAEYRRLRTQQIVFDPEVYVYFTNGMRARNAGVELWGSWQARPGWRLHAGLTRLWQEFRLEPGSNDSIAVPGAEGANPPHQWLLRSSHDLGERVEFDLVLREVAALAAPAVPRYRALDLRLGWQPRAGVELSLGGRNLFDGGHGEFTEAATRSEFGRALFVALALQY